MIDMTLVMCPLCKQQECCNIEPVNEYHDKYSCVACGFESSDLMTRGEFDFQEYESDPSFPELYKEIKMVDEANRVWYPITINIKEKGIVYAFGKTKQDWQWRATKNIKLTKQECKLPKFKNQTHKSDSSSTKDFGKDFFAACDYIDLFAI